MNTLIINMKDGTFLHYTYNDYYSMDIQILNGDYFFTYVNEKYDVETLRIPVDDILKLIIC